MTPHGRRRGGLLSRRLTEAWSGDNIGDLYLGGESESGVAQARQQPVAVAVARAIVAVTTGKAWPMATSTGKADVLGDFIVSKEAARMVEMAGYAGYAYQGQTHRFTRRSGRFVGAVGFGVPGAAPAAAGA